MVAAPLFKRIGLGTVLGYLAVGVALGPVARFISHGEDLLPVAELGVVLLLFIIGLELKPARLWAMRRDIFGLGAAQVVLTGFVLSALAYLAAGLNWQAAVVVGFGLALSSTAFAMQSLEDAGTLNTKHGQSAFFILLFQDVAVAPLLALAPLLSPGGEGVEAIGVGRFAIVVDMHRHPAPCRPFPAQPAVSHHRQHRCARGDDRGGAVRGAGRGHADGDRRPVDGARRLHRGRASGRFLVPPPARSRYRAVPRHPARPVLHRRRPVPRPVGDRLGMADAAVGRAER